MYEHMNSIPSYAGRRECMDEVVVNMKVKCRDGMVVVNYIVKARIF
jgi:hypothetical protein